MNLPGQNPAPFPPPTELQSGALSSAALTLRLAGYAGSLLFVFVLLVGLDLAARIQVDLPTPPLVGPIVIVVVLGLVGWTWILASWRSWRWTLDQAYGQEVFTVESGVWRKVWRAVPLDRIQYVEVHTGVLERRLRLATLVVRTAGVHTPAVHLSGVDSRIADGLRLRLTPERDQPE